MSKSYRRERSYWDEYDNSYSHKNNKQKKKAEKERRKKKASTRIVNEPTQDYNDYED